MAPSRTLFIGMDVHTESMAVADVAQDHGAEVTYLEHACPTRAGRRRLGLPVSGHSQPASATAIEKTAHNDPGHPLEGPDQTL